MLEILRKMFEENPGRSTIVLKDECSDCGCETIIEITPTSEGFGLQGGALFKCSPDGFFFRCPACCQANSKANEYQESENKFIKVLLVDDEYTSRRILNSFLSLFSEVDIIVNSNEALSAVKVAFEKNQPYELIFIDVMAPKLDGIATVKKIRQLESQQGLNEHNRSKIIMTSTKTDKDIILKAAEADYTSFLIKPIDKTRLYNEIRKHGFDIPD